MSSSSKLSPEDIKLRGSLLAKNKELLKLHKELVFGGLLSEEEFWETRQGLLRAQEAALKQKRGLSATLSTEEAAKPVTGTTGTGDIKYVLTPAIIKGIYESHPILKKAFAALVTEAGSLSEKEFWIEYFKSKFFNEKVAPGSGSALLDPYFETESREKKSTEESGSALEQFSGMVDEMVDISRSLEDHASTDYVQLEGNAVRNDPHWNAFRQFNLHSLKILQTCKAADKPEKRLNENYIEIADLQSNSEPALATLNIQEAVLGRRKQNKMDVDIDYNEIKTRLMASLGSTRKQELLIEYSAFKEGVNSILAENFFSSANQQQSLQIEPSDELVHPMNSSLEVLRHFWRAAAMTNSPERKAKLTKLHQVLEQMEAKVNSFTRATPNSKEAFLNLLQVFQVAKLKFQELCK